VAGLGNQGRHIETQKQRKDQTMEQLIKDYLTAKTEEERAVKLRRELGDQIAEQVGDKLKANVGDYKITVKPTTNYKVDWPSFDALELDSPPCRTKRELDQVGLRWYEANQPEDYAKLCAAITATPGRTQIEIKEKKK
jgi:hypothetical protein